VSYATVDDLRDRFEGTIPDSSETMLEIKIEQAERLVRAILRAEIAAVIAAGRATVEDVRDVVCDMVLRTVRNTAGVTSQTAGPFSQSFDAAVASGKLWLTRENRLQLGLRRARSGSAEMVDEVMPYVLQPPCWPELSNASQPDDWY
jgi:hypothetical protein